MRPTAVLALAALLPALWAGTPGGKPSGTAGGASDVAAPAPPHRDLAPTGPSVAERLAEIARRVQAVADYPALARDRGIEGETVVAFEVAPGGRARGAHVEASSGSLALDRAALRAVRQAEDLPHVVGRIRVPVRFAFAEAGPTPGGGAAGRDRAPTRAD